MRPCPRPPPPPSRLVPSTVCPSWTGSLGADGMEVLVLVVVHAHFHTCTLEIKVVRAHAGHSLWYTRHTHTRHRSRRSPCDGSGEAEQPLTPPSTFCLFATSHSNAVTDEHPWMSNGNVFSTVNSPKGSESFWKNGPGLDRLGGGDETAVHWRWHSALFWSLPHPSHRTLQSTWTGGANQIARIVQNTLDVRCD